jgi:ankyrin repeat protein
MAALGDFDTPALLLKYFHSESPEINSFVIKAFCQEHPEYLTKLIQEGILDVDSSSMYTLFELTFENFPKYNHLLQAALTQHKATEKYPIKDIINSQNYDKKDGKEVLNLLLDIIDPNLFFDNVLEFADKNLIERALEKGANLNKMTVAGLPLQIIAKMGGKDPEGKIFKWLAAQGADLNGIGTKGRTPFGEIIFEGREDLFDFCLKNGAKVHPEKPEYSSPLLCAAGTIAVNAKDPEAKIYKKLVELGADQNQSSGKFNATPFTLLVASGNKDHIDWGLAHGALLNPPNVNGKATPLEHAARLENDKAGLIYKHLIEAGADINLPGTDGQPSLLSILLQGKIELAAWCFEHGALLSKPEWHQKAYELAVQSKNAEFLPLLKKQGIKFDPELSPNLLFKGYESGGPKMLNELLNMNCQPKRDVSSWGESGEYSALYLMIEKHDIESFRKLCIFPDFINRNLNDIKRMLEDTKDTAFLKELNKQGF